MTSVTLKPSPKPFSARRMRFVPLKSTEQFDLQALHRVRSRLVTQRTAVINQIRGFLLERGLPIRQGAAALRLALPQLLSMLSDNLLPRVVQLVQDLVEDWRDRARRVTSITKEINELAEQDARCRRLMTAPGVGPIISSAMLAAIGTAILFARAATLRHGRPAIEPFSAAYRGAATGTCERCSFKGPELCF
jgi:transposase